ncbi:hypothetical protein DFS34DRAFT_239386 [Phlyctochytrium arcticum]|nr:hypothetical protein DFS34DRAFT_239386 [Phlyctochytrium arcticum]
MAGLVLQRLTRQETRRRVGETTLQPSSTVQIKPVMTTKTPHSPTAASAAAIRKKIPKTHSQKVKKSSHTQILAGVGIAILAILALYLIAPSGPPKPRPGFKPAASNVATEKKAAAADSGEVFWTKEISKEGDGINFPKPGDIVAVHYIGVLENGTIFDTSMRDEDAQPLRLPIGVGKLIAGWDQAVPTMSLGEHAQLTIKHQAAYGPNGHGPIPPFATLVFDMRLLEINDMKAPENWKAKAAEAARKAALLKEQETGKGGRKQEADAVGGNLNGEDLEEVGDL